MKGKQQTSYMQKQYFIWQNAGLKSVNGLY